MNYPPTCIYYAELRKLIVEIVVLIEILKIGLPLEKYNAYLISFWNLHLAKSQITLRL